MTRQIRKPELFAPRILDDADTVRLNALIESCAKTDAEDLARACTMLSKPVRPDAEPLERVRAYIEGCAEAAASSSGDRALTALSANAVKQIGLPILVSSTAAQATAVDLRMVIQRSIAGLAATIAKDARFGTPKSTGAGASGETPVIDVDAPARLKKLCDAIADAPASKFNAAVEVLGLSGSQTERSVALLTYIVATVNEIGRSALVRAERTSFATFARTFIVLLPGVPEASAEDQIAWAQRTLQGLSSHASIEGAIKGHVGVVTEAVRQALESLRAERVADRAAERTIVPAGSGKAASVPTPAGFLPSIEAWTAALTDAAPAHVTRPFSPTIQNAVHALAVNAYMVLVGQTADALRVRTAMTADAMSLVSITAMNDTPLLSALMTPWLMAALLRVTVGGPLQVRALTEALMARAREACSVARTCSASFEALVRVLSTETLNPFSLTSQPMAADQLFTATARLAIDAYVAEHILDPRVAARATPDLRRRMATSLHTYVTQSSVGSFAVPEWIAGAVNIVGEFAALRRECRDPAPGGLSALRAVMPVSTTTPAVSAVTAPPLSFPPPAASRDGWADVWAGAHGGLASATEEERRTLESMSPGPEYQPYHRLRAAAKRLGWTHLLTPGYSGGSKRARSPPEPDRGTGRGARTHFPRRGRSR